LLYLPQTSSPKLELPPPPNSPLKPPMSEVIFVLTIHSLVAKTSTIIYCSKVLALDNNNFWSCSTSICDPINYSIYEMCPPSLVCELLLPKPLKLSHYLLISSNLTSIIHLVLRLIHAHWPLHWLSESAVGPLVQSSSSNSLGDRLNDVLHQS
jgi:hypothetical protein